MKIDDSLRIKGLQTFESHCEILDLQIDVNTNANKFWNLK